MTLFFMRSDIEENSAMYPPIHPQPICDFSFSRLEKLWEKYPQFHTMTTFSTVEDLLEDHVSYREDFQEVREEYLERDCEKFLEQLSWSDLT